MEPQDPNAQGQELNSQASQPAGEGQEKNFAEGFQRRINELTAVRRRTEEENENLRSQILALTNSMAELATQQARSSYQAPQEQAPALPEELAPVAKYLDAWSKQFEQRFSGQLTQLGGMVQGSEASRAVERFAQMWNIKDTNWVQQRAQALAVGWRQANVPFKPEDAARWAASEYLEKQAATQPRDGNGRFMPLNSGVATAPNPAQNFSPQASRPALPSNFDDLSPDAQIAALRARNGGNDDFPL